MRKNIFATLSMLAFSSSHMQRLTDLLRIIFIDNITKDKKVYCLKNCCKDKFKGKVCCELFRASICSFPLFAEYIYRHPASWLWSKSCHFRLSLSWLKSDKIRHTELRDMSGCYVWCCQQQEITFAIDVWKSISCHRYFVAFDLWNWGWLSNEIKNISIF